MRNGQLILSVLDDIFFMDSVEFFDLIDFVKATPKPDKPVTTNWEFQTKLKYDTSQKFFVIEICYMGNPLPIVKINTYKIGNIYS